MHQLSAACRVLFYKYTSVMTRDDVGIDDRRHLFVDDFALQQTILQRFQK